MNRDFVQPAIGKVLRALLLLTAVTAVGAGGCATEAPTVDDNLKRQAADILGASTRRDVPFTLVRLRLSSVQMPPRSAVRGDIWSVVDKSVLPNETLAALALNGLRVGVGRRSDLAQLGKIMASVGATGLRSSSVQAVSNRPIPIILRKLHRPRAIFTFRPDFTLIGKDLPPGEVVLTLNCAFDDKADTADGVSLTATVQLRTLGSRLRFFGPGESPAAATSGKTTYNLGVLANALEIGTDQFLMVGTSAEAGRGSSVGGLMLVGESQGLKFATVVVITLDLLTVGPGTSSASDEPGEQLALPPTTIP